VKFRVNAGGKRGSLIVIEVEEYETRLMHEYVQGILD
jgi:hypothetical protein